MRYVRRTTRTTKVKRTRRITRKSGYARKNIAKVVKGILSRQAENKVWADYGINQSITSAVSSVMTNKNLLPTLSNSTGISGRIGNQVMVKSGYIRGHVNVLPYDATTNNQTLPVYVKMWIVSARQINTTALSATSIASTFFEIGGASAGPQGNMLDIDFSINKDAWIVHYSKTCKIGVGAITSTGPIGTNSYYDNSPMSVPFYFNFGKKLKTLKYDESTTSPTNKSLWIVFQAVSADGTSPSAQTKAEFHYTTRVEYEDM